MGNTQYKPWERVGRSIVFGLFSPLIWVIKKLNITPNMLTLIGLLLNISAAVVLIYGAESDDRFHLIYVGYGGLLVLLGGMFDMLDGLIAKTNGKATTFGALFDSVLDRYSELFMFLGILYYLVAEHYFLSSVATFMALIGSMMVSYTRARAEALGIPCSMGFMQRPVRVLMIGFGALFTGLFYAIIGPYNTISFLNETYIVDTIIILIIPIVIVAVLSNFTAVERLYNGYKYTQHN
jgi:CDP-diacylglycerol--glycerol-3-phosphate 3-phosphatidyltransferase